MAGLFDKEAKDLAKATKAEATLVVVIHGEKGSGFSAYFPPGKKHLIPAALKRALKEIEDSGP